MSELRSAVESLRGETLAELPDARIEDDFAEIRRIVDQLELEALRRLGEKRSMTRRYTSSIAFRSRSTGGRDDSIELRGDKPVPQETDWRCTSDVRTLFKGRRSI